MIGRQFETSVPQRQTPIAEQPRCAACHGPADRFVTAVRAELKDRYLGDRAVGFNDGDIRGWYWVEIPKQQGRWLRRHCWNLKPVPPAGLPFDR